MASSIDRTFGIGDPAGRNRFLIELYATKYWQKPASRLKYVSKMNLLFLPSHPKDPKPGLHKNRKIMQYPTEVPLKSQPQPVPDDWMYDDEKTARVWSDAEPGSAEVEEQLARIDRKNPFRCLDESAHRIRRIIEKYEVSDQELLTTLMDLLDDELACDSFDQEGILFEARVRLSQLVDEHAENTEGQDKMLSSLKFWFTNLIQSNIAGSDPSMRDMNDVVQSFDIARFINQSFDIREMSLDQITSLHRGVVDALTGQIRELKRRNEAQTQQISELQKALDVQIARRRKTSAIKRAQQDSELQIQAAYRRVAEQGARITTLEQAMGSSQPGEEPAESPRDGAQDIMEDIGRQVDLQAKFQSMTETIAALKADVTEHMLAARKLKQSERILDNRSQALDRGKKLLEQSLAAANERGKLLEAANKKLSEDLQRVRENSIGMEVVSKVHSDYERLIQELKDDYHDRANQAVEKESQRYRKQLKQMIQALDGGNLQTALGELSQQQAAEMEQMQQNLQEQLKEARASSAHRLTTVIRHYEATIKALHNEQKLLQESVQHEIDTIATNRRLTDQEEFAARLLEIQDKAANDLSETHTKLSRKIEKLRKELLNSQKRCAALTAFAEESGLADDMPGDTETHDVGGEEDELDEKTDEVLAHSLMQLKEREVERNVTQKFLAMIKAQREVFESEKAWAFDSIRKSMKNHADISLMDLRSGLIDKLTKAQDVFRKNAGSPDAEKIDELITEAITVIEESRGEVVQIGGSGPVIPLSDLESRFAEVNTRLLDLTGENELLRLT
jgi:hypothetical protein